MKITYTDSGKEALADFHTSQQTLLEEVICEQKYVLGDEFVEVTSADVKRAASMFRTKRKSGRIFFAWHEAVLLLTPLFFGILIVTVIRLDEKLYSTLTTSPMGGILGLVLVMLVAASIYITKEYLWSIRRRTSRSDGFYFIDGPNSRIRLNAEKALEMQELQIQMRKLYETVTELEKRNMDQTISKGPNAL